ncbi:lasso peptide isopeptide bond-forming cyclase [Arenimonas sp. MALMAid1274]|uniref:lasso peptide isopeptide bond-forming cyclase n=1 Tax=Arenimonas sp. MALMAid1274 TaxID=3411630 RepID=UPI003BA02FEF
MGSIFGVFDPHGDGVEPGTVSRLSEGLTHRLSDVNGHWESGRCALGTRLRHTTPESMLETAPAPTEEGLVIAGDTRIDNRDELKQLLGLGASPCADSRLVLAAYRQWGWKCVDHLVGDFAFALYDPARGELFCARDHFGAKPFVYADARGKFSFASQARALVGSGLVSDAKDERRIADFLLRRLDDKQSTFYSQVRRLPPAHCLVVTREGLKTWRYWRPDATGPELALDDDQAAQRFRVLFTEAVACRLRSAFPVGSFLSGGLDSSSVTLVAHRLLAQQGIALPVFSAVFPGVPDSDESGWIEIVAKAAAAEGPPLDQHRFLADRTGPMEAMDAIIPHLDGPSTAANLYQPWGMLGQARDAGVRVMLTGHDGDTVVSHGYALLTELALAGKWSELQHQIQAIAGELENYGEVAPVLLRTYVRQVPALLWRRGRPATALRAFRVIHGQFGLSRRAMLEAFPAPWSTLARSLRPAKARRASLPPGISPSFAAQPVFRERQAGRSPIPAESVRQDHARALDSGLMTAAFEEFEQVSAAFGIESRHPFFDKRLVEFCLSLPAGQKIREGWTRVVLRNAMRGVLPEPVRTRRDKSNLGHNFTLSLVTGADRIGTGLEPAPPGMDGYWDLATLRSALARYRAGPTSRDALLLYLAAGFRAWLVRG